MESLLKEARALLVSLTFARVMLFTLFIAVFITTYTLWENRQTLYNRASVVKITGDFELGIPGKDAKQLIDTFVATHPDILVAAVIDADPIRNRRIPRYRSYGNKQVEEIFAEALTYGMTGIQPLYNSDELNNKQILSVMSGEFSCSPALQNSGVLQAMPSMSKYIVASCRIPIPPAYNEATGWIGIHLKKWPPSGGLDSLKFDSLNMAIAYYNLEISKKSDIKIIK